MKKTIMYLACIIVICLALFSYPAKTQPTVELFMNYLNKEYPKAIKICDSLKYIYIMHHYHWDDTLSNDQSKQRWYDKASLKIPVGYINGIMISNLNDVDEYQRKASLVSSSVEIFATGGFTNINDNIIIWANIFLSGQGDKIYIYLVEDFNEHKRIMRKMAPTEGMLFENTYHVELTKPPGVNIDNLYLIITVENQDGLIIGSCQKELKSFINPMIHNLNTWEWNDPINYISMNDNNTIWPNPADELLYFSDQFTFSLITDVQGRIVEISEPEGNILNLCGLYPGIYLAHFENLKPFIFLKK